VNGRCQRGKTRHRAVVAGLAVLAVAAVGLDLAAQPMSEPQGAAVRGTSVAEAATGRRLVFAPTGITGQRLRFALARVGGATIVTAWLQHRRERRWLSVTAVSRAARRGSYRVRRPSGWSARRTRLVIRTADPAGVHGCGFGRFGPGAWPGACWRPYSAASVFNRPLPAAPRIAAGSERMVARLLRFGPIKHLEAGLADTAGDFGHPTYYSQPGDPLFRLHCYEVAWGTCPIEGHEIRVPDAARPAAGGDAHLTVVDQDTGWEYDLYKVRSKPPGGGPLEFRWGGRTRIDGDGLGSGATAARFAGLAGLIRPAELAAGHIDHALFVTVHCDAGRFVHPARQSGRSCAHLGEPTTDAPPMGTHLQLAMSPEEIAALSVPQWKQTVLRAMATYGMFVGDTGGGSWGLKQQSGSTFTSFGHPDPLIAFARANGWTLYGDLWTGNLRDGVDWATRLRVIDPCVSRRTC
jgi:hypothetical protein